MRWLLLDEVISVEEKGKAAARSHVPAGPVSAEPLLMEMMAQTGGLLLGIEKDFQDDIVFTKIESAEFFGCKAGGELFIEAFAESLRPEGGWIDAAIRTPEGKKVAQARFLLMNVGRLQPGVQEPIVFHEMFMNHFKIREKIEAPK